MIKVDTLTEIRRMKRLYQLRKTQINATTNYHHLRTIGVSQHGNNYFSSLNVPWYKRNDDIITTFKTNTSKIYSLCSNLNSLIDRDIYQSRIDIFKFEGLLPKDALVTQFDKTDRLKILENKLNKKSHRYIQNLEKAYQVKEYFSLKN